MSTKQYTWPDTEHPSQEGQGAFAPFNYFSEGAACCEVEVDVSIVPACDCNGLYGRGMTSLYNL